MRFVPALRTSGAATCASFAPRSSKALLLAGGDEITTEDLFGGDGSNGLNGGNGGEAGGVDAEALKSFREAKERAVLDFERRFLIDALRRAGGNITRAAEEVGMYRQSFQQKMRELGITVNDALVS